MKAVSLAQNGLAIFEYYIKIILALNEGAQIIFAAFVAHQIHADYKAFSVYSLKCSRLTAWMKLKLVVIINFNVRIVMCEHGAHCFGHANFAYFNNVHVGVGVHIDVVKQVVYQ